MKNIVITSDKGGVGKSTIVSLIVEWLNHQNIPVLLTDSDPIQTTQTWANNCAADGRTVISNTGQYRIVDTAGTSGAGLSWLQKADLILAPFQPHYPDIRTIVEWFCSINQSLQKKVAFIPNRYQKTNEQKDGIEQIKRVIEQEKNGVIFPSLCNRPAIYGTVLNGSPKNFFDQKIEQSVLEEVNNLIKAIINYCRGESDERD